MEITNPVHTNGVKKVISENYRVTTIEIEHALEEALRRPVPDGLGAGMGERPMSIGNDTR